MTYLVEAGLAVLAGESSAEEPPLVQVGAAVKVGWQTASTAVKAPGVVEAEKQASAEVGPKTTAGLVEQTSAGLGQQARMAWGSLVEGEHLEDW